MRPADWRFWSALFAATILLSYSAAADCDSARNPEAAIIDCTRSITSGKWEGRSLSDFYSRRAAAYRQKGDNDHAIADYNEAIRLDPQRAINFLSRGMALSDTGANDRAIADFSEAIRLDPKPAQAFLARGLVYRDKGDTDHAIADFSEAIRIGPKEAAAFSLRGLAYDKKGDNDHAIADFSEAIRIDPQDADPFMSRGLAYHKKGDEDRAIADLNEAIRLNPRDAAAFSLRGSVFSAAGANDRAIADYSETIRLDPKSTPAYFARGFLHLFAGSAEKALADFNQASALAPKNAYVVLWVDIAGRRNNLPSHLAQASSRIDMTVWPAPVIQLFMEQSTPAALLAAADDPDTFRKKEKVCDAIFYSGEFSLMKGLKGEATRLFRQAASDCPHGFNATANAELKALGVVP